MPAVALVERGGRRSARAAGGARAATELTAGGARAARGGGARDGRSSSGTRRRSSRQVELGRRAAGGAHVGWSARGRVGQELNERDERERGDLES